MANLVDGLRIETVRGGTPGDLADRILDFWSAHGALDAEAGRERLDQVVCVLLDESGQVTGVNSVQPEELPLISNRRFWVYRAFLAPGSGAESEMFKAAFDLLEAEYHSDRSNPIGLGVFVSDPEEMRARAAAIWPETELFYAGTLPDGSQLRLRYFWDAEIGPGLPSSPTLDETAATEYPLEERYEVEPLAGSDRTGPDDVLAMWASEQAIPDEAEARRRVHEVQMVALGPVGDVAGVSTAYLQRNPQLRLDLWYYRTYVARPHRHSNLAAQLIFRTRDLIEERHARGQERRAEGILFELENPGMRAYFNRGLWLPANFLFISENERGAHVRVHYFADARAPTPT